MDMIKAAIKSSQDVTRIIVRYGPFLRRADDNNDDGKKMVQLSRTTKMAPIAHGPQWEEEELLAIYHLVAERGFTTRYQVWLLLIVFL